MELVDVIRYVADLKNGLAVWTGNGYWIGTTERVIKVDPGTATGESIETLAAIVLLGGGTSVTDMGYPLAWMLVFQNGCGECSTMSVVQTVMANWGTPCDMHWLLSAPGSH